MEDKFILMSMDDTRLKSISEVLGNPSCKKILGLLAEKKLGESEISRELKMPLNTVGYNIKKLVSAGLIETDKHWWSVKGKKIQVYKISNKSIVISPKKKISGLKNIIPVALITGVAALLIRVLSSRQVQNAGLKASESLEKAVESAPSLASGSANMASVSFLDKVLALPSWSWFLAGALFALVAYFLIDLARKNG